VSARCLQTGHERDLILDARFLSLQKHAQGQPGGATRVLVADAHPIYLKGLVDWIQRGSDLELVGEAIDGHEAVDRIGELEPDLALLDLKLPELDGIGVVRKIGGAQSRTRSILLSANPEGEVIYEAIEAGAAAYLSKEARGDELHAAIQAVSSGQRFLSPGLDQPLADEVARRANKTAALSFREGEILELIAEGLSNAAIGKRLSISESTVKSYGRRAFEKLGVSTRAAAIAEAMRHGLLS
jgi:two-component system, NarL family, nitrate/nitrite response regulator NarL